MAGTIWEFFGFQPSDTSDEALAAAQNSSCPVLGEKCEKRFNDGITSGVCSIKPITTGPVICCPIRMYGDDYRILGDIANQAFGEGLTLEPGRSAVAFSRKAKLPCVAVFGKRWGGELRLPQKSGSGGYFVDWVLAKIDSSGELEEFVAVEVQTIDTTGNYRNGYEALRRDRSVEKTSAGLNWENVSKRILPQLIYKGQVLQRERMCRKGLFFVCPHAVYERIMRRLGGHKGLIRYELQPASISFVVYDYQMQKPVTQGRMLPIEQTATHSTTVYKLQEAFNNVTLPDENVYQEAILKALGK